MAEPYVLYILSAPSIVINFALFLAIKNCQAGHQGEDVLEPINRFFHLYNFIDR